MAVYEILFDVSEGALDGLPLAIVPEGIRFTPNQWADYLTDDTDTPAGWAAKVTPDKKRSYSRLRGGINSANSGQTDEQRRVEAYGADARSLSAVAVNAGGTGYAVGDVLDTDSTGATVSPLSKPATLKVAATSSGAIVSVSIHNAGGYSVDPTTTVGNAASGGSGTGATFNLTFADDSALVTAQIAFLDERMAQALAANTDIAVDGEDTNWGVSDLKSKGTLLAELTNNEVVQMTMTKLKAAHPLLPQDVDTARSERILYDGTFTTAARVARWRDVTDYVAVQRSMTPLLYSDTSWHELV